VEIYAGGPGFVDAAQEYDTSSPKAFFRNSLSSALSLGISFVTPFWLAGA
jgi:hypothetical protein